MKAVDNDVCSKLTVRSIVHNPEHNTLYVSAEKEVCAARVRAAACAHSVAQLSLWSAISGKPMRVKDDCAETDIIGLAINANGRQVYVGSADGVVQVLHSTNFAQLSSSRLLKDLLVMFRFVAPSACACAPLHVR